MELGDYETNALLISNISSVAFRIYEPPADQSYSFASAAAGIEKILRDDGHLILYDTSRRAIWRFWIQEKGEPAESVPENALDVSGYHLTPTEDGAFEPAILHKGHVQGAAANNAAPSSSSTGSAIDPTQRQPQPHASSQAAHSTQQDHDAQAVNPSGADSKNLQTSHRVAYENFITAVLLTVSTALCPAVGAVPLNYRTLLLPPEQWRYEDGRDALAHPDAVFASFSAYLTTMGSLVMSLTVTPCKGLLPLDDMFAAGFTSPEHRVVAGPFGIPATYPPTSLGGDFGSTSLAQTPNTQALSFRGIPDANESTWRQSCLKMLQSRGVPPALLDGCSWVNISVPRRRFQEASNDARRLRDAPMMSISWPAPLCFRSRNLEVSSMSTRLGNTLNGNEEFHDPLGNADRWWHATAERENQISKRKADRSAPQPMEIDTGGMQSSNATGHFTAAPGRPSTAAVGTVYPTPPDGVPQPSGITPTFYGAVSSPRAPVPGQAPAESEDAPPEMTNTQGDMIWDQSERKRERTDSNNALEDPESMLMGRDMFGENDITEADFSFFDEQPDNLDLDMDEFDQMEDNSPEKQQEVGPKTEEARGGGQSPPVASPRQDSEGFMKPELKHARSLLTDTPQVLEGGERGATVQRVASPFNPEAVFKKVRGTMGHPDGTPSSEPPERKPGVFQQVEFGPSVPLINQKYEKGGCFAFDPKTLENQKTSQPQRALPETNYLRRHSKRSKKPKYQAPTSGTLMNRFASLDVPASQPSPMRGIGSPSDDDQSSIESDEDDSSFTSDEPTSPIKMGFKRSAPFVDEDGTSQVTSLRDQEVADEPDQHLAIELPRLSKPGPPDVRLSRLFLDPEPLAFQTPLADEDLVNIAQIVTEQAATGSLSIMGGHRNEDPYPVTRSTQQKLASDARNSLNILRQTATSSLEKMAPVRLKGFLEVQDVPLLGQSARLQPRPIPGRDPNAEQLKPSNLYQIPSHHLEVRRAESKLSVLPTAVSFWESLGLAPASGSKNVRAACVFPGWRGMMGNAGTFLDRMKSVYELLRLGSFEKLVLPGDLEPGLAPYEADAISTSPDASVTGHGSALIESMEILHSAMSSESASESSFVIFMLYSPSNPGSIVEACLAFRRFVDTYWKPSSGKESSGRDLVLQLVSVDLVSSPTYLVMTPLSDLIKLCLEMYDRCTSFYGPVPAPAIVLEQALPRMIDFKLTGTPSSSLIQENSCIHVAYAQSLDDRWVTAAWTDDRGTQQATASYCLGRRGRPIATQMQEVAHEIWESTLEIISQCKIHWRIVITKSGVMEPPEIQFWADLARTESKANISMILMTVDTAPSLQLLPPAVQVPTSAASIHGTPVSTPQANILSPEQANTPAAPMRDAGAAGAAAATPTADGSEAEADAVLADLADQTWGAVVGHRLNNSSTPLELQPALVSGYLIKRTSASVEDPPVAMEVNLVHTEATARAYEPLLREMLSNFKGLGTLARARGVVDRGPDVRPWHVAAAEKAIQALYMLM